MVALCGGAQGGEVAVGSTEFGQLEGLVKAVGEWEEKAEAVGKGGPSVEEVGTVLEEGPGLEVVGEKEGGMRKRYLAAQEWVREAEEVLEKGEEKRARLLVNRASRLGMKCEGMGRDGMGWDGAEGLKVTRGSYSDREYCVGGLQCQE